MPLDKLLGGFDKNAALSGALGGAAGGALVSAFTNKKSAKKLLKAGGLVAVGGLAWQAYQSYRNRQTEQVPELSRQRFENAADSQAGDNAAGLILAAMIAAAHADEHLSEAERKQIWQQAMQLGLSAADLAELDTQMRQPLTAAEVAAAAPDMETGIELYAASVMVIEGNCESGNQYLQQLGQALQLPPGLTAALTEQSRQGAAPA